MKTNTLRHLDVDFASELKRAAIRNGLSASDIKALTVGDKLGKLLPEIREGEIPVWTKGFNIGHAASSKKSLLGFLNCFSRASLVIERIVYQEDFCVSFKEKSYDLALVSGNSLGLKENELLYASNIFKKALEEGLVLCPPDLAFYLRVSYKDQPLGEKLFVAMDPIMYNSLRFVFFLANIDGKKNIDAESIEGLFKSSDLWIFVKP